MSVKTIVQVPDKVLKRVSRRVGKIDGEVLNLVKDMKDTLYSTTGIGLAAPQIGVLKRVVLIDLRDGMNPIVIINPKITAKHGKEKSIEGCLSYPGYEGEVIRPRKVTVEGFDIKGKDVQYNVDGFLAKAFCHEIDHLDGILYIDRAKKLFKADEE